MSFFIRYNYSDIIPPKIESFLLNTLFDEYTTESQKQNIINILLKSGQNREEIIDNLQKVYYTTDSNNLRIEIINNISRYGDIYSYDFLVDVAKNSSEYVYRMLALANLSKNFYGDEGTREMLINDGKNYIYDVTSRSPKIDYRKLIPLENYGGVELFGEFMRNIFTIDATIEDVYFLQNIENYIHFPEEKMRIPDKVKNNIITTLKKYAQQTLEIINMNR